MTFPFRCSTDRLDGRGFAATSVDIRLDEIAFLRVDDGDGGPSVPGEITLRSGHRVVVQAHIDHWHERRVAIRKTR